MFSIDIEVKGDIDFFTNLESKIDNFLPLTQNISDYMLTKTNENFNRSKGPELGDNWLPLKRPRPDGKSTPILIDTGALKNSISVRSKSFSAEIGSPIFYASFHNEGTDKMAKRQIIPIDKLPVQWEKDIGNMAFDYLRKI